MKTSTNLFKSLSKSEINDLTKQVKETVAVDYNKSFSSFDLWKIQRIRKDQRPRRNYA
ncbi:MAG: hypothetical protein WKF35_01875 [Ferruginibacter sp.]